MQLESLKSPTVRAGGDVAEDSARRLPPLLLFRMNEIFGLPEVIVNTLMGNNVAFQLPVFYHNSQWSRLV